MTPRPVGAEWPRMYALAARLDRFRPDRTEKAVIAAGLLAGAALCLILDAAERRLMHQFDGIGCVPDYWQDGDR